MRKKSTSPERSLGDLTAQDYREFAETFRAAATLQRHSVNIAFNKPVQKCLPSKSEYEKFLSSVDYIQKKFFEYYEAYMQCATTMEKNQSANANAVAN